MIIWLNFGLVSFVCVSICLPVCLQAQLIHDRNTASHSTPAVKASVAASVPEKVQMTWTKEKFVAEKHKNKDTNVSGFKDIFNMKP